MIKKDDFEQERLNGRVAKILIASTFSELVEMDFVGYGDFATFLHIQDTFSRFSAIVFMGVKKKEGETAEMIRRGVISYCLSVFGAPRIMVEDKDSRFTGEAFREFCAARIIVAQTVIPCHRQSLGRQNVDTVCFDQLLIIWLGIKTK